MKNIFTTLVFFYSLLNLYGQIDRSDTLGINDFIKLYTKKSINKENRISFDQGNWEVYIIKGEGTEEELAGFTPLYSDNKENIKNIFKDLIISKNENISLLSHYTQHILLIKDGKEVLSIGVASQVQKINIGNDYYNYNSSSFHQNCKKLKKVKYASFNIPSLSIARKFHKKMIMDSTIYYPKKNMNNEDISWMNFEGQLLVKFMFSPVEYKKKERKNEQIEKYVDFVKKKMKTSESEYIDVPDSLDFKLEISDDESRFYDSLSTTRKVFIKNKIKESLSISENDFKYQALLLGEGRQIGYVFCNKKHAKKNNSLEVVKKWEKFENIPFIIYGKSSKQLKKIIKKLEK